MMADLARHPTPPVARSLAMGRAEWGMMLALSVIWGGSFLFMAVASQEVPTLSIVATRVVLGAAVLWAVIAARGLSLPRGRAAIGAFVIMGVINNAIPFTLLVIAAREIPSGLAAILNATTPLFAVLIAGVALSDEPLRPARLAGVLLGLGGVVAIMGGGALTGGAAPLWAEAAVIGAAVSYGAGAVFGRVFARMGIDPMVTAAGQLSGAALIVAPLALMLEAPWRLALPSGATLGALGALAVVSTGLAYVLYFRILARAGAGNIALVTLLVPVWAALLGALVLGERLGPAGFGGFAMVAAGLWVMQGRGLSLAIGRRRH